MQDSEQIAPFFQVTDTFTAHSKHISSIAFATTHPYQIATASADASIKIWSLSSNPKQTDTRLVTSFTGHTLGVSDISWSAASNWIASASDDHTVGIWDIQSQKNIALLGKRHLYQNVFYSRLNAENGGVEGHSEPVTSVDFNPQGSLLASSSFDESVRLWDNRTFTCVANFLAHQEPVISVAFSNDGTLLATASYDGLARVWDVRTRQCLRTLILQQPPAPPRAVVANVKFSANSRYIFCSMLDQSIRLWDYMAGSNVIVKEYKGHVNTNFCITSEHVRIGSMELVISGSEDHSVVIWDLQSQEIVQKLQEHTSPVLSVAWSGPNGLLASASGTVVKIWKF